MSFRKRFIGGVVALALVVTMVNLGLWQLRRHEEKQRLTDRVESRMDLEPVGVQELYEEAVLSGGGGLLGGENGLKNVEHRRVSEIGDFNCEQEVLIRNRTLDGRPGYWVFTPFVVSEAGWDSADEADGAAGSAAESADYAAGSAANDADGSAESADGAVESATEDGGQLLDVLRRRQSYIVNRGWLPLEFAEAYIFENTFNILGSDSNPDSSPPAPPDLPLSSLLPPGQNPCNTVAGEGGEEITGLIRLPKASAGRECESLAPVCTFAHPDTAAIASHLASAAEAAEDFEVSEADASAVSSLASLENINPDFYIQLESAKLPLGDIPVLLAAPSFDEGNHFNYAVQWFIFSTIAAVGYFLIFWGKAIFSRRGRSRTPSRD